MKRMSEVFKLPVSSGDRGYCADEVFHAGGNGEWCATFCANEQAQHAAHAINHVDALANALEDLIACCRESGSSILGRTYAEDALAAYRGDK